MIRGRLVRDAVQIRADRRRCIRANLVFECTGDLLAQRIGIEPRVTDRLQYRTFPVDHHIGGRYVRPMQLRCVLRPHLSADHRYLGRGRIRCGGRFRRGSCRRRRCWLNAAVYHGRIEQRLVAHIGRPIYHMWRWGTSTIVAVMLLVANRHFTDLYCANGACNNGNRQCVSGGMGHEAILACEVEAAAVLAYTDTRTLLR